MKLLLKLLIVALFVSASFTAWAQKIGVLDIDLALKQSQVAKIYYTKTKKRFSGRLKKIKYMDKSLRKLADRIKKEGSTMSVNARNTLELEYRQKSEALQLEANQLRAETTKADRKALAQILPLLQKAVQKLVKLKGYDLIIEKKAAVYSASSSDVTKQVVALMNHKS